MARGINKVIIVGNCGQDPDTKYSAGGAAITNISIATSESWKDKQTGQTTEKTEWHRVVFFNRLAEIAGEYLRKGSKVYIEGKLQTRKWQDQGGQERYTTEIIANELQMLDSRGDNMPGAGAGGGYPQGGSYPQSQQDNNYSAPAAPARPQAAFGSPAGRGATPPPPPAPPMDSFDDDIPF